MEYILNRIDESDNGLPASENKIIISENKIELQEGIPLYRMEISNIEAIKLIMHNDDYHSDKYKKKFIMELLTR